MASFVKFYQFVEDLGKGYHQLHAGGHQLMIYLTNATPDPATDAIKSDIAGITEENGYSVADVQNDFSQTGGVATLSGVDITWTASGGSFGPFRYAVLYNESQTSPVDPLIGYWDYGAEITVSAGEDFMIDIVTSLATFT